MRMSVLSAFLCCPVACAQHDDCAVLAAAALQADACAIRSLVDAVAKTREGRLRTVHVLSIWAARDLLPAKASCLDTASHGEQFCFLCGCCSFVSDITR
jgi:hypothetical protein